MSNRLPNKSGTVHYCKRGPKGNNIFAYSWWVYTRWVISFLQRVWKSENKPQELTFQHPHDACCQGDQLRKYSACPVHEEKDLCKYPVISCTWFLETISIMLWISWCQENVFHQSWYFETYFTVFVHESSNCPTNFKGFSLKNHGYRKIFI